MLFFFLLQSINYENLSEIVLVSIKKTIYPSYCVRSLSFVIDVLSNFFAQSQMLIIIYIISRIWLLFYFHDRMNSFFALISNGVKKSKSLFFASKYHMSVKKITTSTLLKMKMNGEKISMLTAYDFSFARLFDAAGIDIILVGDSASNVMAGNESTLPITLDQMIYHAQCVMKGIDRGFVVVDLPFGSYQSNSEIALASAIKIMKETGAHAIKLEGGEEVADSIKRIVNAGIPVMGHLGLTPQSINKFGSYVVRAKENAEAEKLKRDSLLLEEAGCFGIVLEKIPALLAKEVTESINIPTIGIGAGKYCDGQVLVMHDMLGINSEFKPRFIRQYLNLEKLIKEAIRQYISDVKANDFPNELESY